METQPLGTEGVPIKVEAGLRDMKNSQYVVAKRDNLEELTSKKYRLQDDTPAWLETSQSSMSAKAKNEMTDQEGED